MQNYTINLLIAYIYNRFALVFFICLLGSFVKDWSSTISSLSKFDIKKIISSSITSAILICAVTDYIHVNLPFYILICFFSGLWSYKIMEIATSSDFLKKVLRVILGRRFDENELDSILEPIEKNLDKENTKYIQKIEEDSG